MIHKKNHDKNINDLLSLRVPCKKKDQINFYCRIHGSHESHGSNGSNGSHESYESNESHSNIFPNMSKLINKCSIYECPGVRIIEDDHMPYIN